VIWDCVSNFQEHSIVELSLLDDAFTALDRRIFLEESFVPPCVRLKTRFLILYVVEVCNSKFEL
jgi:hypothetical protein